MQAEDERAAAANAVRLRPLDAMAWIVHAECELDAGDARAGEAASQRALALRPGHPEALARLGRAQWMQGRLGEAATSLRAALDAAPQHPGICVWLAHVYEDTGAAEEAAHLYARALELMPGQPQIAAYLLAWRRRLCNWRDLEALATLVRRAVNDAQASVEPFAFLSEDATALEQLRCARLRASVVAAQVRPLPHAVVRNTEHAPLRVGFMSNGFGEHPTGLLTVALFEAMRAQGDCDLQLFALNADDGGPIRARLAAAAHALHDLSTRDHDAAARHIRQQQLDILVDLRGWGGGGAPDVLARRPAPVQVNWLAYPGTSGAPWIDYVVADGFVLPAALRPAFSEHVALMPRCFQPSDTSRVVDTPPPRAAFGLPETGTVFCCFNNSYKLNPRSMGRALRVLQQVPDSVLWLLSGPGEANARLRAVAQNAGVAPERLVFMPRKPHVEYLASLCHADLFLDTEPYNAHTTASDALWAGCPVLTRPGETFAARVAGSLNHHLGLAQLNVPDDETFVRMAAQLALQPGVLTELREDLAQRRAASSLFDMQGFARDFTHLLGRMAQRQRAGLAPAPLHEPADLPPGAPHVQHD